MTDITGTAGVDTIDVTGDVGTLNGTPQGGPITGINSQGGYDTITVSTSSLSGVIDGGSGGMDLTVTDSTIGTINSADGTSNITTSNSAVSALNTNAANATVNATNTDFGAINTSAGDLTMNMTGGSVTSSYAGGTGSDALTFTNATIANGVTFDASSGNDILTFNNTTIGDNFNFQAGSGDNTINIQGTTSVGSNATFDALASGLSQLNLPDGTFLIVHGEGSYTVGTHALPSGSDLSGSFVLPDGSSATFSNFDSFGSSSAPVCFTEGTLILTPAGEVPVETLSVGDLVVTATGEAEPILWIGARLMEFHDHQSIHRPVQIKAGALGAGRPTRDLAVSPQHCLLVDMPADAPVLGTGQVFVRAKFLTGLSGVRVMKGKRHTRYVTFLLSRHQIVQANGAWAESFYPGPMGLKMLPPAQRRGIKKTLSGSRDYPHFGYGPRAARVLARAQAERLVDVLQEQTHGRPVMGYDSSVPVCIDQTATHSGCLNAVSGGSIRLAKDKNGRWHQAQHPSFRALHRS